MEKASWNFEPGDEIAPRREFVEGLGGGKRYEVCLVWDEHLFALAVAKVLRPDRVEHPGALRGIRREAELLARLAHPVIVRGYGAVLDGPHPHVLIEYLEGMPLRTLVRRGGPVPLEQLVPLLNHLLSALHYLAAEEVVHLDVKPSNIVVGDPPRLIDLSLARPVSEARELRKPIGTWGYMAPEQCDPAANAGAIGPAADVWSLGATVFNMLTGDVPFPRDRDAAASDDLRVRYPQLVDQPRPLPRDAPRELAQLVEAMLSPAPADRPTAAEAAEALEPLAGA